MSEGLPDCVLCGSKTRNWMTVPWDWRRPQARIPYPLCWCDSCDFGQVFPRPSAEEIAKFYEVDYYTHAALPSDDGRASLMDRMLVHLAWRVDRGVDLTAPAVHELLQGRHANVCEIGCGNGSLLSTIRDQGHTVVGLEPDPAARAQAQAQGLDVYAGTAEEMSPELGRESFDLVVMSHVLEHCLHPVAAINNARGLLKPGGLLVCETPNNAARGLRQSGASWPWLDVPRHLNFFTTSSLRRICETAGLSVRNVDFTGYTRQFMKGWREDEKRVQAALTSTSREDSITEYLRAFSLLAQTAFADSPAKYDSVRVVASVT